MSFLRNNVACLTKRCRKYFGRTIMSLSIEAFGLGNIFFLSSTPSLAFTTASQPASNRRLISLIKNDDNPTGARPPGPTTAIVPAPTVPPIPPTRRPTVSASSHHRVAEHSSSSVARRRWPVDASARSGQVSTGFVFVVRLIETLTIFPLLLLFASRSRSRLLNWKKVRC